jgi:hypothetical protein
MSLPLRRHGLGRMAAAALLPIAGCGPVAPGNNALAQPVVETAAAATPPASAIVADATGSADKTAASTGPAGAVICPAALAGGAVPKGARLLGDAMRSSLSLSSATVTADAPSTIAPDTDGMAEVMPDDGPETPGMIVQYYDAEPSATQPYTLVCRYGASRPKLLAQAVLLLPVAPAGRYRCTTELPQGNDKRPASASCVQGN